MSDNYKINRFPEKIIYVPNVYIYFLTQLLELGTHKQNLDATVP